VTAKTLETLPSQDLRQDLACSFCCNQREQEAAGVKWWTKRYNQISRF